MYFDEVLFVGGLRLLQVTIQPTEIPGLVRVAGVRRIRLGNTIGSVRFLPNIDRDADPADYPDWPVVDDRTWWERWLKRPPRPVPALWHTIVEPRCFVCSTSRIQTAWEPKDAPLNSAEEREEELTAETEETDAPLAPT